MCTSMIRPASVLVLSFSRQPACASGEGRQPFPFTGNYRKIKKRKTDATVTQEAPAFRRKDP